MKPDFMLHELADKLPAISLVSDCFHANVGKYLLNPDPLADPDLNILTPRYVSYIKRANYVNVVRKTVNSLAGLVFSKYPLIELDEAIKDVDANINGAGLSIAQQAREVLIEVLIKGRAGLLADYPDDAAGLTRADVKASGIKPFITVYTAEQIINWRVENKKLTLVVLSEKYLSEDDGFEAKYDEQLLVLRLVNGIVTSERYRSTGGRDWVSQGVSELKDGKGNNLDQIPFFFVGAQNNDETVDDSPMFDIAKVSIAHYRNSADYEDSVFLVGQPTLFISGLTQDWNGADTQITLGSREAHLLPLGATIDLIQAEPNNIVKEAMDKKEQQMVFLGAKLIEPNTSTKTATEAGGDLAEETSVLATLANNVSDAYTKAVNYLCRYVGVDNAACMISLNTNFATNKMTIQDLIGVMQLWQGGAIAFSEMRDVYIENETATIEDAELAKEVIKQQLSLPTATS